MLQNYLSRLTTFKFCFDFFFGCCDVYSRLVPRALQLLGLLVLTRLLRKKKKKDSRIDRGKANGKRISYRRIIIFIGFQVWWSEQLYNLFLSRNQLPLRTKFEYWYRNAGVNLGRCGMLKSRHERLKWRAESFNSLSDPCDNILFDCLNNYGPCITRSFRIFSDTFNSPCHYFSLLRSGSFD